MTPANDLPLVVSWFPTAKPDGPAIGDPERTTWRAFLNEIAARVLGRTP